MAKSDTHILDHVVAGELQLALAPRVLTLKHVTVRQPGIIGFYFLYQQGTQFYLDAVPIWAETDGLRVKPERFILPVAVAERLKTRQHVRWYFADASGLHRVQAAKEDKLHELFWFVKDPDPFYRSLALVQLDAFNLRKKALVPMRLIQPCWHDCSNLRVPKLESKIA